jgi:hypothetical protein
MIKENAVKPGMNLKQFFEASVSALQNEGKAIAIQDGIQQRNRALVSRSASDANLKRRAVADAAKALSALWKMQTPTRTT